MVDIKDVLFWIFMFIAIALIIWRVFGESPYDFYILFTLSMGILFKLWSVNDKLERHLGEDRQFKRSFMALAQDFKEHIGKE